MKILLALGGNALLPPSGRQSFKVYQETVKKTAKSIASLAKKHRIAITHGNGSQVGNLLLEQEACKETPRLPLDVVGAETQGQIGYLLQKELQSLLPGKEIFTLVTQVLVDEKDPAFKSPSKPVGPFYSMPPRRTGWALKRIGRKWRRVVASPQPVDIVEKDAITRAFGRGAMVIACGGGGIPVTRHGRRLEGVEAVIDKDMTGSLLASLLKVDMFMMLTDVKGVYLNYEKRSQKFLRELSIQEAKRLLKTGEFGEGSMKPKVEAALQFVRGNSHGKAVIASLREMENAAASRAGTVLAGRTSGIYSSC
jgi:carbamate kinase